MPAKDLQLAFVVGGALEAGHVFLDGLSNQAGPVGPPQALPGGEPVHTLERLRVHSNRNSFHIGYANIPGAMAPAPA